MKRRSFISTILGACGLLATAPTALMKEPLLTVQAATLFPEVVLWRPVPGGLANIKAGTIFRMTDGEKFYTTEMIGDRWGANIPTQEGVGIALEDGAKHISGCGECTAEWHPTLESAIAAIAAANA